MAYQYDLLAPIDFSSRNRPTDAQATNVQRLKNAAYEDSPRGTMSFFAFYRPIIEQYVAEFARMNPFFRKEQEADLFWLTMRHAFALLRSYEHKGYGSFRNLLRQLVNYNALQAADKMAYMEKMQLADRETCQSQFLNMAIQCLVLQRNPEKFAKSKIIRDFIFQPQRMARHMSELSEAELSAVETLLEQFESEVDAVFDKYTDNSEGMGAIEALAPILGEKRLAELVRWGAEAGSRGDFADSFFGRVRKDPSWFNLPADMFEDDGASSVSGLAEAAQP